MASAEEQLLFDNGAYRLTSRRLEQPGLVAELVSPACLRITRGGESREVSIPTTLPEGCARMHSSLPVLQAMYALSVQELQANISPEGHLLAGAAWSTVWTRDIAFAAALGTALADPLATRASLESRVRGGVPHGQKKLLPAVFPFSILRDTAAADNTVDMRMVDELLSPCMQN